MGHVENKRKRYISTDSQKKVFSQIRFRKQNKSAPQASAGLFDLSVHSEDAFQTSALLASQRLNQRTNIGTNLS